MSILTAAHSRDFVRDTEFPTLPRRSGARKKSLQTNVDPVVMETGKPQALVVGSGIVVAAEGVPAQTRADLVDCTLFAQLSASGTVPDKSDVTAWYDAYFTALTALGWAQSERRFEKFSSSSTTIDAHKSVVKVLTTLLGPASTALMVVAETFSALESMQENSPWITLFDRQATAASSASFQVATAQLAPGGLVEIALAAFDLRSRVALTQLLFFKFKSSSTSLQYASGNATIYEAVLADNRQAVSARLAAYRASFIGQIKFPPPPEQVAPASATTGRRTAGAATKSRARKLPMKTRR